ALLFFASIRLEVIRKYLPKIVIFTLIISILTFIPGIGIKKNGAARWIGIGSSTFQPSELIKMVLVLFLANIFAKKYDRFDEPSVSIYPATILSGLFIAIVYLQNDLSTSLFLIFIAFIMFFISGVPISFFIKIMILVIPLVSFMVLTKEYRVERVISFFHPERDPLGAGYQVNAALSALGEGGFWGRGLGNGIRKISSIPEVQSDFIFAVWSEEMGFLGVLLYYALLLFFTIRGVIVSINSTDRFRGLLGFGCTSVIFVQSIMNCGVIVRAFPATGVPLPFFSSGGSSLIITLCLCGLILNVSRHRSGEDE
ncbi:MAG TPA: putative peptidoglycan glycosyltransferase FtsW, partial [Treponemataceae bacterium]|nr:putative peptidoglycan glycosyltransferase FtsW [Treponemataceae bacterium]